MLKRSLCLLRISKMSPRSLTSELVYMGSLIWPLGETVFPSKLTRGESYVVKSSGFRFDPLYRLGYITSTALPWSTSTLFTSYPPILSVTTRASSWDWMVPILSPSENPSTGEAHFLAFLDSQLSSSVESWATDITLERQEPVLPRAVRMTFIVPMGGLKEASLRVSRFACPYRPLEWCRRCLNFPSRTSWSKWYLRFL